MRDHVIAGAVLLVLSMSSGCANIPRDRSVEELARATVIEPEAFHGLDIPRLRPGREDDLHFAPYAIATEHGPSRFAIARLPQRRDSAVITVRSHMGQTSSIRLYSSPEAFAPHVQLLDGQFKPIAALTQPATWVRAGYASYYEVEVLAEPEATYILVYTDPQLLELNPRFFRKGASNDEVVKFHIAGNNEWQRGLIHKRHG